MKGVQREGDIATCGDTNTGSLTVKVNGNGVTRVGKDSAGAGIIQGPGSLSVFVETHPVSLLGDAIEPHGDGDHAAAFTANASTNVLAQELISPRLPVDVGILAFNIITPAGGVAPEGQDWQGPNVFDFTIVNSSVEPIPPFTIGIFEIVPDQAGEITLPPGTLRRPSAATPGISLVWELQNVVVQPGGTLKGIDIGFANFMSTVPAGSKRFYILALDIDFDLPPEVVYENNMSYPSIPTPYITTGDLGGGPPFGVVGLF